MSKKSDQLTIPDLVVLKYLSAEAKHGYQLNSELELHEVKDWAGISRAQVYYSLAKLEKLELIRSASDKDMSLGPERRTYKSTQSGLRALASALGRDEWATQRPPPPFLTWLALSSHADATTRKKLIDTRENFLFREIEREKATLESFKGHESFEVHTASIMVGFTIASFELELKWIEKLRSKASL